MSHAGSVLNERSDRIVFVLFPTRSRVKPLTTRGLSPIYEIMAGINAHPAGKTCPAPAQIEIALELNHLRGGDGAQ